MSKISDAVKATAGRTAPMPSPIIPIKCEEGFPSLQYAMGRRYHIGVELHASTVFDDNISGEKLNRAIQQTKRLIAEEVFGEFRNPIYRLQVAIFERDLDKAHAITEEILKQMFDIR